MAFLLCMCVYEFLGIKNGPGFEEIELERCGMESLTDREVGY